MTRMRPTLALLGCRTRPSGPCEPGTRPGPAGDRVGSGDWAPQPAGRRRP